MVRTLTLFIVVQQSLYFWIRRTETGDVGDLVSIERGK